VKNRDQAPMIESRNIGRTGNDFQCCVRIINGLFAPRVFGSSSQQVRTQKGRREAGLSRFVERSGEEISTS